ncbi:alpha/beta hydrolase [Haloterrigena salina JCM 13891]|uniref:Alpha/beta hydrolase n=1 Tax=Haloterrigena salina JCM 13891 TaxID=1227488 RepID=M0C9E0_9EURY|nr:alpha/beta hydrolase [Haloterrigena salina]ELZ18504.1 alpha/beta hydrolase [Haloterrigena salina JCM 13891]
MNLPDGWTTGTVSSNGVELRYYRTGTGPPIVLAHGFNDTGRRWVPLAEDLAADYEVIAYDARGHGRSDAPETGYRLADRIADLHGLVTALDLEDPVLVGHSMGGGTVAWTAARRPTLAKGVVVVEPDCFHRLPEADPDELFEQSRTVLERASDRTVEEIVEAEYSELNPTHARRLATGHLESDPAIAELARQGYPSPLVDVLPDVSCRSLVLRSDADIDQRVADLNAADSLRSGRLVHVSNAGHYVFRDAYDAAYTELRTFLRRV